MSDYTDPTPDELENSDKLEKKTIGGELRYYVKNIKAHWPVVEDAPDAEGHAAWFTPDGRFHVTHEQLRRDAAIGAIV
ncbi:hypothetical protein N1031_01030 [Herbiconiux moechotypicola]|uniref:Uncharacterized protein n=1 Tax=Herbiconiux moechotypicola TaxID=637393 RepID=A0ABN3D7X6_9MICO|nr:hypothetical protein [Herbiconiux moechotypicola]MCS5728336.1 hypothetical protein [Herbiconiux moechotypicola]